MTSLCVALRKQADRLVSGEFVTGLEQINLLYEAAEFIESLGGSSSPLTPGAGDATQGAKDAEPGTVSDSPPPKQAVSERNTYERAAWAATDLGLKCDELQRRLALSSKALSWFYDDHVIVGDPPCPCEGCEKARMAFASQLVPLPEARHGN